MNIVFTARKSSAVSQAIKGNFTGPEDLNLILGKGTRIEVYLITKDGLKLIKEFGIYGEITILQPFRPPGYTTDLLLLTTAKYEMLTLALRLSVTGEPSLHESSPQFSIISDTLTDLSDRHARPADYGQLIAIDPTASVVCLHLYQGLLKCVPVNPHAAIAGPGGSATPAIIGGRGMSRSVKATDKTFLDHFNITIEEVEIIAMDFLHGVVKPTLAILYQDQKKIRHIKTYELDLKAKEKSETGWSQSGLAGAQQCISVPQPIGGIIVTGEYSISYFNPILRSSPLSITIEETIMNSIARVDDQGHRYLLGDHEGGMYVLILDVNDSSAASSSSSAGRILVTDMKFERLGSTSISEAIVYLDNHHVFVGSHLGDSQLVLLHTEPDTAGEFLEVMETFTNVGPVLDFEVVDLEGQGQGLIVSCSGAFKDGSLRVVRNGVGINDQAVLELPGIKRVWSLKDSLDSAVVRVTPDTEMVQENIDGFLADSATLVCGNAKGDLILQVTPTSVRLIAPPQHIQAGLLAEWTPPVGQQISVASMNATQCLVAVGGSTLINLDIGSETITQTGQTTFESEIACIDVTAIDLANRQTSPICAVGLWDIKVHLVRLATMEIVATHDLPGAILPRSLLMTRFESVPYLLVGLGDGQLVTFILEAGLNQLNTPKKISLGTQPIILRHISSGQGSANNGHVFACSDRPTVIYSSNRKLLYSNVNLKEVATACSFNCEAFPNSLAIVGSDDEGTLRVGSIDEFQELHVQSYPTEENDHRIAYLASRKCFGVVASRMVNEKPELVGATRVIAADEDEVGFIRIYDDQTFDHQSTFELDETEIGKCIASLTFSGDPARYLAVGTAYIIPNEEIPLRGRILILEVSDTHQLKLVAETEVKGGVISIREFNGKLLAAVNSELKIYNWKLSERGAVDSSLALECSHRGFIMIVGMATHGDFILAGDLMKSVMLLRYKANEKKIEEIARDSIVAWPTAVEMLDDETFIMAENENNLVTLVKNTETTSDAEARKLQRVGCWHIGEQVNCFKPGTLIMSNQENDAPAVPKLLFATVSGTIGVIASLNKENYELLRQLEINLSRVIRGVGGLDHASWRNFKDKSRTLPQSGFIDGDLIELFLDLNEDEINLVMEGKSSGEGAGEDLFGNSAGLEKSDKINVPVDEVTKMVEELLRLH
ncbi:DNA damage-binding protein 1a [Podila minutissima]|uniref:DNA damage-binding protein 1a n=1 Tax=Podila minutissima TaxID=64525 RepID=A0A9P5SJJ8_9FUNG|nr:DNA damage-binding protein 1a [Podila minutissima]